MWIHVGWWLGAGNEYTLDSGQGIVVFDVPVDAGSVVVTNIPVTETKDFATWS